MTGLAGHPIRLTEGVFRIRVPLPGYAANQVYVLLGAVPTLIDAGHPDPSAQEALDHGLLSLGLGRADLAQVLYTHTHVDHLGGGILTWTADDLGHVEQRLPSRAVDAGVDRNFGRYTRRLHAWDPWLESLPPHPIVSQWIKLRRHRSNSWTAVEEDTGRVMGGRPLLPGTWVDAGDRRLLVVEGRGHDPYHVVFLDEGGEFAITGDIVLLTPTPLLPPMDDDATTYREALGRLRFLAPRSVFPAHGSIFRDGPAAIRGALALFDRFADGVLSVVRTGGGREMGPGEVLADLFLLDPALQPRSETMVGVLLGNIHSHLLRLASAGRILSLPGHLFRSDR